MWERRGDPEGQRKRSQRAIWQREGNHMQNGKGEKRRSRGEKAIVKGRRRSGDKLRRIAINCSHDDVIVPSLSLSPSVVFFSVSRSFLSFLVLSVSPFSDFPSLSFFGLHLLFTKTDQEK